MGEALALRRNDVDEVNSRIRVDEALCFTDMSFKTTKNGEDRWVGLQKMLFPNSGPLSDPSVTLARRNDVRTPTVVVRRALYERIGGFDQRLSHTADWDMWVRLAAGARTAACHEALVAYVVHEASMHLSERADLEGELAYFTAKHADLMNQYGVQANGLEPYRWVAWTNWIAKRRWAAARIYLSGLRRHGNRQNLRMAARQALTGGVEAVSQRYNREDFGWLAQLSSDRVAA